MENDDRVIISNNDLKLKCFKLFPLLIKNTLKDKFGFKSWFDIISDLAIEFGCLKLILNHEKDQDESDEVYNSQYRFMRYFIINTTNPYLHHHFIQYYSIRKMIKIIQNEICVNSYVSLNLDNPKFNQSNLIKSINLNELDKFINAWEVFRSREQYLDDLKESQLKVCNSNDIIMEHLKDLIYKKDELDSLALLIELSKNQQVTIDLNEITKYFLKYHNKLFFSDDDTLAIYSISESFNDQELIEQNSINYSRINKLGQNAKKFRSN